MKIWIICLFCIAITWGNSDSITTQLHISTWPHHAEVRMHQPPHFRQNHPHLSTFIATTSAHEIPVYIRKTGYQDTAFKVQLNLNHAQNFVFIKLREELDLEKIAQQHKFDQKRKRARWGSYMIWSSAVPTIWATAHLVQGLRQEATLLRQWEQAKQGVLTDTESWRQNHDAYEATAQNMRNHQRQALIAAILGVSLSTVGVILKF